MHRSRLLIALGLATLFCAATILAQSSSPWPFPPRPTAPGTSAGGSVLRAAFWNIKWFPGGRPNAYKGEETRQIKAVHAEIPQLDADIIGLEEVRDWDSAALAVQPLPGFKVDVCSNFPAREGQATTQQVAITSRLQPMSAWAEQWKASGALTPPRGFAFAAYQVSPRNIVLAYAVHLKSNRGEVIENIPIREESTRQLIAHMKAMEAIYGKLGALTWIVGGDFNTSPDDPRFQAEKTIATLTRNGLLWVWQGMPLQQRITMPPEKSFPAACFDHIFYLGAALRKAQPVPTTDTSSDHRAIRAEFILPGM